MKKEHTEGKMTSVKRFLFGLALLTGVFLTACSSDRVTGSRVAEYIAPLPHAYLAEQPGGALLLEENTRAGDALAGQLLRRLGSGGGVLAASLVELNNLDKASLFGQTSSQQIGSRLSQHGFKVLESRLGAELRLDKINGEFMLTRESARLLAGNHDASSVLLGVYSETRQRVYVSVRVVRLGDNAVIAAYEYYLPKNDDILALLAPAGPDRANARGSHEQVWAGMAAREKAFRK